MPASSVALALVGGNASPDPRANLHEGNLPDQGHLLRELLDPHLVEQDIPAWGIVERVGLNHARDRQITHGTTHAGQGHALPTPP